MENVQERLRTHCLPARIKVGGKWKREKLKTILRDLNNIPFYYY